MSNLPEFVYMKQIAVDPESPGHNGTLYGVTEEGFVFWYEHASEGWKPISMRVVGAVSPQQQTDIRNLITLLDAHQQNTGEYLEADDASVFQQIKEKYHV